VAVVVVGKTNVREAVGARVEIHARLGNGEGMDVMPAWRLGMPLGDDRMESNITIIIIWYEVYFLRRFGYSEIYKLRWKTCCF